MRVRGTEVARGGIMAGHQLAMDPGDAMGQLAGVPTTEPAFGLPAVWVADAARAEAEALGYTVVDDESVVVTHLTETIRAHAAELLTRQETRELLDQLKERNAAVVEEVVPDVLSLGEIQRVLQALLPRASRSATSARSSRPSATRRGSRATRRCSPSTPARRSAARSSRPYLDARGTLRAIAIDPGLEQEVAEAIVQTAEGEFLAMDPTPRAGARRRLRRAGRPRARPGRPARAAVLGARAPAPAAAVRAAAPAARRLLLQRDRAGRRRRDVGRHRRPTR